MVFVPNVLFTVGLDVCSAGGLEAARARDYPLIQDLRVCNSGERFGRPPRYVDRIYQEGWLGMVRYGNHRLGLGVPGLRIAILATQHTHSLGGMGLGCVEASRSPSRFSGGRPGFRSYVDPPDPTNQVLLRRHNAIASSPLEGVAQ